MLRPQPKHPRPLPQEVCHTARTATVQGSEPHPRIVPLDNARAFYRYTTAIDRGAIDRMSATCCGDAALMLHRKGASVKAGATMIRGQLLDLRPLLEGDLAQLETWAGDPEYGGVFNTFALRLPGAIRRAFAEHGYLTDEAGRLLIATKAGEAVGDISYRRVTYGPGPGNRVYEIGISIAPAYRGRRYGAEAQRLLAAYLFEAYPIERVQASTDVSNIAEQRALERAGFTREGVLRRAQFRGGAWHDLAMYSKLRGE